MPMTPHQRRLYDLRDAMRYMNPGDLDHAIQDEALPSWARAEYQHERNRRDIATLHDVAKALLNYADAVRGDPELFRGLARVAVPGGYDVRAFAMKAIGVATRLDAQFPALDA